MRQLSLYDIKSQLQRAGFKMTPQREALVHVLIQNKTAHLSAEELFMLLKRSHPDIGLATVYRTLEILTQLIIVKKIVFEDGIARYDLKRKAAGRSHHHLQCVNCGEIEKIYEDLLFSIEKKIESDYLFRLLDHRLTFHGICKSCQLAERDDSKNE